MAGRGRYLLLRQDFIANGTFLAIRQAILGAGRRLARNNFGRMRKLIDGFRLFIAALFAGACARSLGGAGGCFFDFPFAVAVPGCADGFRLDIAAASADAHAFAVGGAGRRLLADLANQIRRQAGLTAQITLN